jgi:hypothetical protein
MPTGSSNGWIEGEAMIGMPQPPRIAWLKSFWLIMSVLAGIFVSALGAWLVASHWIVLGVVVTLTVTLPGWLWPEIARLPYQWWDRLAREFARYARGWLTLVCFQVVFVVVGLSGSSLGLKRPRPGRSLWRARGSDADSTKPAGEDTRRWISAFCAHAVRTGNWWAVCLVPFLLLLSALETDREENFPAGIYTLF